MEDKNSYDSDGVELVLQLIREQFGDDFKAYFNGQPTELPKSVLPCVMATETNGTVDEDATGLDRITETILIIVALNDKDDLSSDPEVTLTDFKLRKIVKGQYPAGHPNQYEYVRKSIMYALRRFITLNDNVISNDIQTDFDVNQRGS